MTRAALPIFVLLAVCAAGAVWAQDYNPSAACKVIDTCNAGSGGGPSSGGGARGGSNSFSGNANDQTLQQVSKALTDLINRLPAAPPPEEEQQQAQAKTFTPLDPSQDYSGKPCSYFTKPEVRPDGSGINFYADDSYVKYGSNIYHCVDRRWVIGLPESGDARNAQEVEN